MMIPVISLTFMVNFANAMPIFEKGESWLCSLL